MSLLQELRKSEWNIEEAVKKRNAVKMWHPSSIVYFEIDRARKELIKQVGALDCFNNQKHTDLMDDKSLEECHSISLTLHRVKSVVTAILGQGGEGK